MTRGYFEDVEFCLRAREKGFRQRLRDRGLCRPRGLAFVPRRKAPAGHAQSGDPASDAFPTIRPKSASFVEADPLRRARGAIEALLPADVGRVALVCAGGAPVFWRASRAEVLAKDGGPAPLICACVRRARRVARRRGGWPQSLGFPLNDRAGFATPARFPAREPKSRGSNCSIRWRSNPPCLPLCSGSACELKLPAGDLEWAIPMRTPFDGACRASDAPGLCPSCAEGAFQVGAEEEVRRRRLKRKRAILARADAVRPLDRMSEQIAAQMFGDVAVEPFVVPPVAARPSSHPAAGGVLAMILPQPDARAERIVVAFGRALRRLDELARIVVFGACVNDLAVMRTGNIFVAGPVEIDEYDRLLRQYEISALMSPYRGRLFGWTDRLSSAFAMPKACFDYSFGKLTLEDGDLALDPRLCDAKAASRAAQWFAALPRRAAR